MDRVLSGISGGKVDLEQLVSYISQGVTDPPAERPEDLNEMFRLYDVTGSGFISVAEMTHLMTTIGEKLTEEEVQLLLRQTRCVENGRVNYKSMSPYTFFHLIKLINNRCGIFAFIFQNSHK